VNRAGKQRWCGSSCGQGAAPFLATQVVGVAHPGDILTMVTTRGKAVARRSVGTQTEAPRKDRAVQVSGCRECLSLALVPADSRDDCCVRCEQVNDLLSLVAELKEEVERLRSIRECEREINWWSSTLPSLRQRQQEVAPREAENPLPSCHRVERGDLRDGGDGNRSLLRAASESPPGLPYLPSCP